jgi:LysR family transcriptional regulator, transcriptional activator of the cysJI operon
MTLMNWPCDPTPGAPSLDFPGVFLINGNMQFESFKTFCDLAETESFTQAAHINGITQSAVSQTVSALERQFKSLLVERSKKNFRLTAEGQVVYDYSKRLLQSYDAIHSKIQELRGVIVGEIRLATVYSIGLHELPPCVTRFLKEFPTVNVRVEYRHAHQVYEDVLGNVVDLGLVAYPTRDPKLEIVPLRKDSLVLICHPEHPLAKLDTVKLKALNGQKFVNFEKHIPTRKALDRIFKEHDVEVQNVMQFDNVETVKGAVEIDAGVAIVPQDTIKEEVAKGKLAAIPLEGKHLRELGVIYKKGKVLSPALKKFVGLLKESL